MTDVHVPVGSLWQTGPGLCPSLWPPTRPTHHVSDGNLGSLTACRPFLVIGHWQNGGQLWTVVVQERGAGMLRSRWFGDSRLTRLG